MSATTRSKYVELTEHTTQQVALFASLVIGCCVVLMLFIATPAMESFFRAFLRSEVLHDGQKVVYRISENRPDEIIETHTVGTWALVDEKLAQQIAERPDVPVPAEYIFKPLISLTPIVIVASVLLSAVITTLLPPGIGLVRQKIEREILNVLDRLAWSLYGEHTAEEIKTLTRDITTADTRRLHDLAEIYNVHYTDLELLQRALRWRVSNGFSKLIHVHDGVKFYMREYFTDRYSNAVLGVVYIGAAMLIIVIGIRGLKFLPASDPSVVLGALSLEFMLLITYAAVLMYGRQEDQGGFDLSRNPASAMSATSTADADSEQLLRAFLGLQRSATGERRND
ncbi:MAG: hypothetical protein JSS89_00435 [Bacteroidetes bacterium]|nr:hypothetical protein [Bacteroidota bacterium]